MQRVFSWRKDLSNAIATSRATFDSAESIGNLAHAQVAMAMLAAFHSDADARIYAEPRTPFRRDEENAKPPDLLLLHPLLGALLVEVKGWSSSFIDGLEAGTFLLKSGEFKNPWTQAQAAAAQIQKATRGFLNRHHLTSLKAPFFDWVIALPSITRAEWKQRRFDECIHSGEVLLAEDLAAKTLRNKLLHFMRTKAGPLLPCSAEGLAAVRGALGASCFVPIRRRVASDAIRADVPQFSDQQSSLIEARFDGRPQLIRGVAGSGKTSVLVGNCVRLVDRMERTSPGLFAQAGSPKRVAIVFFNRALAPFIRQQFDDEYRNLTGREGPHLYVEICHLNRLLYLLSAKQGGPLQYLPVTRDDDIQSQTDHARHYLAQLQALPAETLHDIGFDAIYVDEGQDLLDEEYKILVALTRVNAASGKRNLVVCYDDAQNVYARPRPTWQTLGIDIAGRSTIMRRCFRNTKETINFSLNVLLGASADKRAGTEGFADTRDLRAHGLLVPLSDRWLATFAERSGPAAEVALYSNRPEERRAILDRLRNLLQRGVPTDEILLLFHGNLGASQFAALERDIAMISGASIFPVWGNKKTAGGRSTKDTLYFQPGTLTLGTLQSLKGQDAAYVLLMGADLFSTTPQDRAAFYVAATRARNQLFVTGLRTPGTLANECLQVSRILTTDPAENARTGLVTIAKPKTETLAEQLAARRSGATTTNRLCTAPKKSSSSESATTPVQRLTFCVGDKVHHPVRGEGVVTECETVTKDPYQESQMVTCTFHTGSHRMDASLARLRPAESPQIPDA